MAFPTKPVLLVAGGAAVVVAAADLLWGNTNTPVLPTAISDLLSQQVDIILIAIGVLFLLFAFGTLHL